MLKGPSVVGTIAVSLSASCIGPDTIKGGILFQSGEAELNSVIILFQKSVEKQVFIKHSAYILGVQCANINGTVID